MVTEYVLLDSLVVTPDVHEDSRISQVVRYTPTRTLDLAHTTLGLSVDWQNQTIQGVATLLLTPFAYPTDTVILNAQYFDIHSVSLNGYPEQSYIYDGSLLKIPLRESVTPDQRIICDIAYTAHPYRAPSTQKQGFFFIDPLDTLPHVPRHIWTIGETHYNSQWFPTIDIPNERQTHDLYISVDTQFVTLSNGILAGSERTSSGLRTDHWVMSQPHAPYLTMLVVGNFDVVSDYWNGIPVNYYVDQGYGASAKDIFAHTPEMLTFFSEILSYPYPWPKYDQVVVHDFTAGAMENTTAVTFALDVQKHSREFLVAGENDGIVSHELFHHWFGNLLTCESWSHLVLNEGFANYGEYLWKEYKYGKDDAQQVYLQELQGYLHASQYGVRSLVEYHYDDPDALFDAHSYNKGCLVLHHLRYVLGDTVFFRGVRKYLHDNAYRAVEVHDLRLAMEEVSGVDLNAFFDQWYFSAGHPEISVSEFFDSSSSQVRIDLSQVQDPEHMLEVFRFPLDLQIFYSDGSSGIFTLDVKTREQKFSFPVLSPPVAFFYDPFGSLPWRLDPAERTAAQCRVMMSHHNSWLCRREAVLYIAENQTEFSTHELRYVLNDPHWTIRQHLLLSLNSGATALEDIAHFALNDPDVRVRLAAYSRLCDSGDMRYASLFENLLTPSNKVAEIRAGLEQLARCDPTSALLHADRFAQDSALSVLCGVASVYALHTERVHRSFFRTTAPSLDAQYGEDFFTLYVTWVSRFDPAFISEELDHFKALALSRDTDLFVRYYATYAVWLLQTRFRSHEELGPEIRQVLEDIKRDTTEPILVNWYLNFN